MDTYMVVLRIVHILAGVFWVGAAFTVILVIQPTAKELRFDAIGWVSGIREAERLARQNGRPVFLFSNVGQMDIGRC